VQYYNELEWLVQALDAEVNSVTGSYDKNRNQVKRTIGGSAYTLSYDTENHPSGCALKTGLTGVTGRRLQRRIWRDHINSPARREQQDFCDAPN
jgi:hypothetical protein